MGSARDNDQGGQKAVQKVAPITVRAGVGAGKGRIWNARLPFFAVGGVLVLLTIYVFISALGRWDAPIPGLLTDPFGHITNYGWPSWSGYQQGLSFPSSITAVEG